MRCTCRGLKGRKIERQRIRLLRSRIRLILNPPNWLLPAIIFSQIHFGSCAIREPSISAASLRCNINGMAHNWRVSTVNRH